ncbi:MAG: glutaredoxin 3 [Alphaproteobacteria bacterium]|nr:glutaredoxin 3 [Alphaproteobacteria bacterium]OJV12073.1 MAG: glutaredoxin 3 [Alphaproteobacteria bacterium 33-17]
MSQAKIIIYTKNNCPYCVKAKHLLTMKNVAFEEIDTTGNDELRLKLVEMSGGRKTVPQIFINDVCYGGFDDIYKLDQEGKLDVLWDM